MTIRIRPQAVEELDDMAAYLGRSSPATAFRFLQAWEQTLSFLEQMPGIGHPCLLVNPMLKELRWWPVQGFQNHLIYYLPVDKGIEVLHLFHGARNVTWMLEREKD
jgi:toxin ParE1/3/4